MEEKRIKTITYIASLLAFYLKGSIIIDPKFVKLIIPNTLLKAIPLGSYQRNIPVNQISSVETNFSINLKAIIPGALLFFVALGNITDSFVSSLIFMILGAAWALSGIESTLLIFLTSEKIEVVSFIFLEKRLALEAEAAILTIISDNLDNINVGLHSDRIINAINNKTS